MRSSLESYEHCHVLDQFDGMNAKLFATYAIGLVVKGNLAVLDELKQTGFSDEQVQAIEHCALTRANGLCPIYEAEI